VAMLYFRSDLKVTTLGQDIIMNMCGKFGIDPEAAVLEKKFKMFQPIRGQGGHIGFWICFKSNNTWLNLIKNICGTFGVDPCSHS